MEKCGQGAPAGSYYLAVEIGGTKQQMAVGTADGRIAERRQVKPPKRLRGRFTPRGGRP